MSNDKHDATYSGGTDWYRQVASIGEPRYAVPVIPGKQDGGTGERPWVSPGPPPWAADEDPKPWPPRWFVRAVVALFILTGLIGVGSAIQKTDVLPHWVPWVGKDSGVAACQAIVESDSLPGRTTANADAMTTDEYQQIRGVFADSRYTEIREPGVKLMDLAWQVQGLSTAGGNAAAALPLIVPFTEAYTALAGGCAQHGYVIKGLGA